MHLDYCINTYICDMLGFTITTSRIGFKYIFAFVLFYLNTDFFVFVLKIPKRHAFDLYLQIQSNTYKNYQQVKALPDINWLRSQDRMFPHQVKSSQAALRKLAC